MLGGLQTTRRTVRLVDGFKAFFVDLPNLSVFVVDVDVSLLLFLFSKILLVLAKAGVWIKCLSSTSMSGLVQTL